MLFSEQDYAVYLDKLGHYANKHAVRIHAFTLMTNHVHMLMTPSTEHGVSKLMQSLGRYYLCILIKPIIAVVRYEKDDISQH
ncbi:transposase [Flavobacterium sp. W21_SRS_FM6]|uniref:transposase n=1 Tax=Flavobacterium sp. W21_SRS_FM6 TaxID=3240268 RepID=UPI003F9290F7